MRKQPRHTITPATSSGKKRKLARLEILEAELDAQWQKVSRQQTAGAKRRAKQKLDVLLFEVKQERKRMEMAL